MNEWDKAQAGYLYDANYDREIAFQLLWVTMYGLVQMYLFYREFLLEAIQ